MRSNRLDEVKGGGIHMWREVWSTQVSKIYEDILSERIVCLLLLGLINAGQKLLSLCLENQRYQTWPRSENGRVLDVGYREMNMLASCN